MSHKQDQLLKETLEEFKQEATEIEIDEAIESKYHGAHGKHL